MVVLHVLFLVIGLVIGTRVGLRGLAMFCYSIGLMYVLVKVPTHFYKIIASHLYDLINPGTADAVALLGLFVLVVIGAIQLGWQMARSDSLMALPLGIDSALGGAVGGALGWVLIELMLG
ncbi:MAG: hypothetical protein IIA60_00530 [Candidatus Marinimicrobia bacterium]|nr:hypothetical protein [Candidatus Neomarinimicrobiota bacterium]